MFFYFFNNLKNTTIITFINFVSFQLVQGVAGYWGNYRCNAPPRTTEMIIDFIGSLNPTPDFVIYTGNLPLLRFVKHTASPVLHMKIFTILCEDSFQTINSEI